MSAPDRLGEFAEALVTGFGDGSLIRLKLGGYHGGQAELKSAEARKVLLKAGARLSVVFRYKTRDITKNLTLDEALAFLRRGLMEEWRSARLETTGFDLQFERQGDKLRLKRTEIAGREAVSAGHDRAKNRPLAQKDKPWLHALGITGKDGVVRNDAQDKFRQINRMVEIFAPLIQALDAKNPRIVDMGAGKGYLDFAPTIISPALDGPARSSAWKCARNWWRTAMNMPAPPVFPGCVSSRAPFSTMMRAAPMR